MIGLARPKNHVGDRASRLKVLAVAKPCGSIDLGMFSKPNPRQYELGQRPP